MLSRALTISANLFSAATTEINTRLQEYTPTQIILVTLAASFVIKKAYATYRHWDTKEIINNLKDGVVQDISQTPIVGPMTDKVIRMQASKELQKLKNARDAEDNDLPFINELPKEGLSADVIKTHFSNLNNTVRPGRLSGALYSKPSAEYNKLIAYIVPLLMYINPMHASAWPKIKKMEAAVLAMCKKLFNAPPDTHAILTYGGTYSILEACDAFVEHARKWKIKEGERPEIIVATTAHAAFKKAAKMFNAKLVEVPVDANGKADVRAMEAAITKNTCMIVGSYSFMYGVFDPLVELGEVAERNNIFFHVDACLAGFEIPFAKAAGQNLPPCDLSIPTIDSYSADIHKFGEGIKGTSVLFIRQKKTFSPTTTKTELEWPGGAYVTQGMGGSGTGLFIGAAYATLLSTGENGYVENQKEVYALRDELVAAIKQIPELNIPFTPELSVIGIRTKPGINAHLVIEKMHDKGWYLNTINTVDCKPEGFHLCLTAYHTTIPNLADDFINDLKNVVDYLKEHPNEKPKGEAKVYGTLSTGYVPHIIQSVIGNLYQRILNTTPHERIPGFFEEIDALPLKPAPNYWMSMIQKMATSVSDRFFAKPSNPEMKPAPEAQRLKLN